MPVKIINKIKILCRGRSLFLPEKIKLPDNIRLLFIPPYSPELNPIEQLWAYLRRHFFSNRIFENSEVIDDEVERAWNTISKEPETIKNIIKRKWMAI